MFTNVYMCMRLFKGINIFVFVLFFCQLEAQKKGEFEVVYDIATTSVKNQGNTGCCWAFSTTSFIESEIMRMGGPELDLSEMFTVYYTYQMKAKKFVMKHGYGKFGQGGLAHDVLNVIDNYGFVPEEKYFGRPDTSIAYNHAELELSLKSLLDKYIFQANAKPSDVWYTNVEDILKNYMGEVPSSIVFNKRNYSPVNFAKGLGVERENYIEISSYTHHPFYSKFNLEIPDNWSDGLFYNLPLDEMIEVMKGALAKGYTFVWDGDVSEDYFSQSESMAIIPVSTSKGFVPQEEKEISQQDRQKAFESWQATDDHLMHIVGLVKDKEGKLYFKVKNSWGANSNKDGGYLYMSEQYARRNTVSIMLNKEALSKDLKNKISK